MNLENEWQGSFRSGWLDLVQLRYAIETNDDVDALAVTCLDQVTRLEEIKVCTSYLYDGPGELLPEGTVRSNQPE